MIENKFMNFGQFYIGQPLSDIKGDISEVSEAVYKELELVSPDDKIYRVEDTNYCDAFWETIIGTHKNQVYRIALHRIEIIQTGILLNKTWLRVFEKLTDEISDYTDQEQIGTSSLTAWDTKWGNVILNETLPPYEGTDINIVKTQAIDITVTGRFAFKKHKRVRKLIYSVCLIAGIVIANIIPNIIAPIIYIFIGIIYGRKIDTYLCKIILKRVLKIGYLFILCLIWGSTIALGVNELIIKYSPNVIMMIICYTVGLNISFIFYKYKKRNNYATLIYGVNFKQILNGVSIFAYIVSLICFNYFLNK